MQQLQFLFLCLVVSVAYSILGNSDNKVSSTLKQAAWYAFMTISILIGLSWVLYFLNS